MSASGRRHQVKHAVGRGLSVRRACALLGVARSAWKYRSKKKDKDMDVTAKMRELSGQYGEVRVHR